MGWWSCDIMGGDSPLDIKHVIYCALGIEHDSPLPKEIDLESFLKKVKDDDPYYLDQKNGEGNILFQVLGVLMMKYGCTIPDHLKNQMIEAAKNDEWANEEGEDERKEVMDNFINVLKAYDGTPVTINSKGLFEVMAEKLGVVEPCFNDKKKALLGMVNDLLDEFDSFTKEVSPVHWRSTGTCFVELKKIKEEIGGYTEMTDEERVRVEEYLENDKKEIDE